MHFAVHGEVDVSTMSLQILRLSSEISPSKVSPSWKVDSENGSLWYSTS